MKKIIGFYFLYVVGIWLYFSFFYPLETYGNTRYAAYGHAMFFSKLPLPWLFLYVLINRNYAAKWGDFAEEISKREWIRSLIFCGMLVGVYYLVELPFNLIWYGITQWEGTSHQPVGDWAYEEMLSLMLYGTGLSAGVYAARLLMDKFYQFWWLFMWILALPVAIFFVYIQPVWIDPLYQDFTVMEPGPLRSAIEEMTTEAGLNNADLLQVNMSEETNTFNAYVSGLWGNERIVLWDTMLEGMDEEAVIFVLSHEIGHYVYRHVPLGVAGYLVLSLFLLGGTHFLYQKVWRRRMKHSGWKKPNELRAVPILLLIVSLLLAALQPVSLAVSRQIEIAADEYAIEHTENAAAGVTAYTQMAVQSKTDISPLFWVKWFRYSHPPIQERIDRIKIEERETR